MKILLVEDDAEWRNGLMDFFRENPDIEFTACVSSRKECLSVLKTMDVDVVLMEIMLKDGKSSGLDATLDISCEYPSVKVIVISSLENDDEMFYEAFLNGAYDYVYKTNSISCRKLSKMPPPTKGRRTEAG